MDLDPFAAALPSIRKTAERCAEFAKFWLVIGPLIAGLLALIGWAATASVFGAANPFTLLYVVGIGIWPNFLLVSTWRLQLRVRAAGP